MAKIFDAHCDVLYKMWLNPNLSFEDSNALHVNLNYMKQAGGKVQCFAIYIPESVNHSERFNVALEMVDIFYDKIINKFKQIKLILNKRDISDLKDNEIGAILTLEGCDAIGHDITKLKTLYRLGVRSVGLTWNYANAVADGALETRNAGLTLFGKKIVELNNQLKIWTDVSHLNERSFWDTIEIAHYPIASHSNVYSLFNHPRNLRDDQIKALIKKDGMIGITFVPYFLSKDYEHTTISDIIKHIDYIFALGGETNLGLGSDFDGIDDTIQGLEHYGCYQNLLNELQKHFKDEQIYRICLQNFVEHFPN
ncbi:dipeptidase [Bacillus sp. Marseille-P3661]|uniref:dipeptidase n=1 Tax=Bacillus sp. Marseille-P3661 TaxID=1936234 RepID=UPI000C83B0AC|nr:dipeptidase [Bacillus sp. Marseille-P3661]